VSKQYLPQVIDAFQIMFV